LQNADFGFVHEVLTFQRLHAEAATAFSDRVNTYLPGNLMILKKYGRIYLDDSEYKNCLRNHMNSYYRFLAQALVYGRDRETIEYHKKALRSIGCDFSVAKLLSSIGSEFLNILGNPKKTVEGLARKIRRRIGRGRRVDAKYHKQTAKESARIEEDAHA
jgi:hypothetical protein